MLPRTDDDLYCRGAATLVASWEAYTVPWVMRT